MAKNSLAAVQEFCQNQASAEKEIAMNVMQCPYRNSASPLGCDLVADPEGIAGAIAHEFCEEMYCRDCPLFQAALADNLRYWSENQLEQEALCIQPGAGQEEEQTDFWHLNAKSSQPHFHPHQ